LKPAGASDPIISIWRKFFQREFIFFFLEELVVQAAAEWVWVAGELTVPETAAAGAELVLVVVVLP